MPLNELTFLTVILPETSEVKAAEKKITVKAT